MRFPAKPLSRLLLLLLCLSGPAAAARLSPLSCAGQCTVPVSYCSPLPDALLPEPDSWFLLAGLAVCLAGRLAGRR